MILRGGLGRLTDESGTLIVIWNFCVVSILSTVLDFFVQNNLAGRENICRLRYKEII